MATFIDVSKSTTDHFIFKNPGDYIVFLHNVSGKYTIDLAGRGVNVDIFGLFTGKNTDQFHIETIQHHKAPQSTSNLLIKGVFEDESKFLYQGLIRIEKDGQQSHAYQKNQNLILSPNTFVESKPYLEILANDVFCTHGSTTGKLNQEQLFYAQSRGLSFKKAKNLLVQGFIDELYNKMRDKMPQITFN